MKNSLFQSRVLRWGLFSLMVMVLMFAFGTQNAKADLKATDVFEAWDRSASKFEHGNVSLWLDPDWWVPMFHVFGNDNDAYPNACGPNTSSIWAGELVMQLDHLDTTGGAGFQASRNWTIVECDRSGDGKYDNKDLSYPLNESAPLYGFKQWSGIGPNTFRVISQDVQTDCTSGTCANFLATTMFVNLDPDCDNTLGDTTAPIDPLYVIPAGGLCFYAEAQPPAVGAINWEGNLQARIFAGGGDKTVNFSVRGPSAVSISDFSANSAVFNLGWAAGLVGLMLLVVSSLYWWMRR